VLISLTILIFALGLATQLLMETAQLFMGSTREARSTQVPQAVSRMRADVIASSYFAISVLPDGSMDRLVLAGHPAGTVAYQLVGTDLVRTLNGLNAEEGDVLWHGVDSWTANAVPIGGHLLHLEISYRQTTGPQFLLRVPGGQGPRELPRLQSFYVLPRGGGLGTGW
jgi:hypothetical protein